MFSQKGTTVVSQLLLKLRMSNRKDEPSFFKALVGDFRNKLCLPKALRMKLSDKGKILLRNPNTRRSWLVSVNEDDNDLFLCNEWTIFANDNDLQLAEILIFRSSGESEFTVKIFGRNGCEKEFPSSMDNNEESPDVVMTETGSQVDETRRPLTTFLKANRYNFYVPRWWAKVTSLDAKDRVTLLDPSNKSWPVNVYHGGVGHTFLSTGWSDFTEDNGLETGDTLCLQFVDKDVIRIDIIQRKVESTDITTEKSDEIGRREKGTAMTGFISDYPYCSITMQSSYVSTNFYLCLPVTFARTFIKDDPGEVILRVPNGTSWPVHYTTQPTRYTLAKGLEEICVR